MNKLIKSLTVILAIAVLSVLCGLAAAHFADKLDRARYPQKYTEFVEKYADIYKVPRDICYAVICTESGFQSTAVSAAGAIGLMQMMPATFADLTARTGDNYETGMLYDPETSIRYGIYYLSMLYDRYGVWDTAFAAYNCGMGRVDGWIAEGRCDETGRLTDIPIDETRTYVARVNTAIAKYEKLYSSEHLSKNR